MPNFSDATDSINSVAELIQTTFGGPSPPPAPPVAPPRLNGAPTVSATPVPGQGIALDSAGRLPTAVNQTISGYELAYVELSTGGSSLSITGTTSGSPTAVVAAPSIVFDGQTTITVSFYAQAIQKGTTSMFVGLFDGTTLVTPLVYTEAGWTPMGTVSRRVTPSQGPHTYGIKAWVDAGTGLISSGSGAGGANAPAFIQIARA